MAKSASATVHEDRRSHKEQEKALARRWPWLLPLAAGLFLGAAAFEMMPEAIERAQTPAWWWAVGGVIAFVAARQGPDAIGRAGLAWVATLGIWIHSFLEGAVTASSYGVSFLVGLLVSVGLILHLIPEIGAVIAVLTAAGLSLRQALIRNAITWGLIVVGFMVVSLLLPQLSQDVLGAGLAFGAGGFLYLAFASWQEREWGLAQSIGVAAVGVLIMAGLKFIG
jgi:zinc transporter ZupT